MYCSGGDHLSVWDHDMNLLYTYNRRSLDCEFLSHSISRGVGLMF